MTYIEIEIDEPEALYTVEATIDSAENVKVAAIYADTETSTRELTAEEVAAFRAARPGLAQQIINTALDRAVYAAELRAEGR